MTPTTLLAIWWRFVWLGAPSTLFLRLLLKVRAAVREDQVEYTGFFGLVLDQ